MNVIRKDATITNTDDAFPGSFQVVLSAPTKDRDGETLLAEEWKQPLPDHITFDIDHEMSVKGTVGSGRPWIDYDNTLGAGKGALIVDGTYSSLQHAQDTRTLVKEGHINRTSVAFMTEKTQKDGRSTVTRELLNGAFVAIPANREAVVLSSKGVKAGARNSAADAAQIQAIHDTATSLGATCSAAKSLTVKDGEDTTDPAALVSAADAALDAAIVALDGVDTSTLPAEVQQAIDLIQAADVAMDELLDALGIPDPDEDADSGAELASAAGVAKAAPAADVKEAPVEDNSIEQQSRAARFRFYATLSER